MLFRKTRIQLSNYLLKRKLRKLERSVNAVNLEQCHSVLVLGSLKDDPGAEECQRFVTYLKRLDKEVFCLVSTGLKKKKAEYPQLNEVKWVRREDLNYLFTPTTPEFQSLLEREFDLLVDLTFKRIFPIKYFFAMSKARFKVGAASAYRLDYADMTIEIDQQGRPADLITQLKHYLNLINKKQHVA